MSLRVIDTSSFQAALDFRNVDYDAAMIKATEGIGYVNPYCDTQMQEVISQGKPNGVYHFGHPENDATQEADYFVNNIQGYLDGTTLLVLDYETNTNVGWALTFLNRVYDRTGVKAVIYLSESTVNAVDWSPVYNNDYGLWVAKYLDNVQDTNWDMSNAGPLPDVNWNTAAPYIMWQWTSKGRLNGYGGDLDLSIFYGDKDTWLLYSRSNHSIPPVPTPPQPPVEEPPVVTPPVIEPPVTEPPVVEPPVVIPPVVVPPTLPLPPMPVAKSKGLMELVLTFLRKIANKIEEYIMSTYNQPTLAPTSKVSAVGIAGIVSTAVVAALAQFHVIVPADLSAQATDAVASTLTVVAFIQAVIHFGAGYFKKSKLN